jgi:hypothetical protein
MIIQTAPAEPRLAVMMYEHTQLFPGSLRELSVAIASSRFGPTIDVLLC